ncbi:NAD kinase [Cellulomonas endophytica]|uniref:NAD kinase n=1 Tax=Cellulomonas endophytica TaxID=2494735 RepID=UPI001012FF67|nr:NAD kinase [Cellulomonas endophytica]
MRRRALVVVHRGRPEALEATDEVLAELERADVDAVVAGDDDALTPSVADVDLVIVLGGDGTILRAAELTRECGAPLLGINLGHVGFLAEAEREDVGSTVRRLTSGAFTIEARTTVEVVVRVPGGPTTTGWALNEAALEKADRARMIEVLVEVDGRPLSSFGCDGIIVATATGSTAHAFSAGGPVVWPDVDGMIVVPVSAHALFARPLVLGPRTVLAVEMLERSPDAAVLTLDGRRRLEVPRGARLEVRRSPVPVRMARMSPAPFTTRLVNKFALPVVGWRDGAAARRPGAAGAPGATDPRLPGPGEGGA